MVEEQVFAAPAYLHEFTKKTMFTNEEIARYYDLSEVHYRLFWQLEKSHSLHYGYWEPKTKNFAEALQNTNRVLADRAAITEADVVLDAGCGVGGSALWLAKEKGCRVKGVTLSEKQIKRATTNAANAGLSGQVQFEKKDYTATGYAAGSFSVVWGLESVCHAPDKRLFLKEAHRLLKKGGRLVIGDFFKTHNLQGRGEKLIKDFAHSWAIDDFASWEDFQQQLQEAGFTNIQMEDASKAILPSAKRLYRAYLLGKPAAVLYRIFKGRATALATNNVESAYLQYVTLKNNWWRYRIVVAEK